jgi:hypothetical protein
MVVQRGSGPEDISTLPVFSLPGPDLIFVAGCSAPLSCGVAPCSGLANRRAPRRILQMMSITGLLAAAAGCLVLMLAGMVYVLLILIVG